MIIIDQERPQDFAQIEAILEAAFGPERSQKSSSVLRQESPALAELSFVARSGGDVAGTVRLTPVHIHDPLFDMHRNVLLLGPLAVDCKLQSMGLGAKLMEHAIHASDQYGVDRIMLVGDIGYYQRFGFEAVLPRIITMPGGRDTNRLLVRQKEEAAPLPVLGTVQPGWVETECSQPQWLPAI